MVKFRNYNEKGPKFMTHESLTELKQCILMALQNYCKNYFLFKPTHYSIAKKYIEKLNRTGIVLVQAHTTFEGKGESGTREYSIIPLLKIIFGLYKLLLKKNSEIFATNIGLILARELGVNEVDFLKYREARILTQRYIKGFGLFESQVYRKSENKIITETTLDPIYSAYNRLNNRLKLSKLITKDQVFAKCD
jgi:hypothetical protein